MPGAVETYLLGSAARFRSGSILAGLLGTVAVGATALAASTSTNPPESGTTILARRCVSCHNAEKKSGGLDLTTRAAALSGKVLGAKEPDRNRLLQVVLQGRMPPTGKLSEAEVALLRAWLASGAKYPAEKLQPESIADQPLWSLLPIRRPTPPSTKWDQQARNPIDRFVFRELQAKGLSPSAPASKLALLRRVTVDLTGLPPTPEEVFEFVNDPAPNAYEKVVDRLLASPAYGERWARHWLDVVRYGESHGYEQNHIRPNAWPYRDYVIQAFNRDTPYDQFIREQLAGDIVAKGDLVREAATGFLVAGIHDTVPNQAEEGSRQQRSNDLDDIVSTTGEAFLGLTVGCAKCHDHKFDPIPQKDYYRLAAVFAGVRHGERKLSDPARTPEQQKEAAELEWKVRVVSGKLSDLDVTARDRVLRGQGVNPVPRPAVNPRRNVDDFPPVRARFVRFVVVSTRDGTEPCLDELEIYGADPEQNLALASSGARATASSVLPGYPIHQIAHLNDGRYGNDWSWISNERGSGWAQIELPRETELRRVVWSRDSGPQPKFEDRVANRYRIEVSTDGRTWKAVADSADRAVAREAIPGARLQEALTPDERKLRGALNAQLAELRTTLARYQAASTAYVGQFTAPDPVHVLIRGDVMQRGAEVTPGAFSRIPGLPADLQPLPEERQGGAPDGAGRRLALAAWLTHPKNPLTARVMVNRIWQHHFGRGIVSTPSDFGHNGSPPSHPELLDWLASDFMAHGWRMKRLHRMIVTSYVYRQSSEANPQGMAADAGNVLLWRMPLRRMEGEAIRDAVLATSGNLNRAMGGPSFQLFKYRVVNVAAYEPLEQYGPETWRRSIYRLPARSIREELLGTFDCPESSQRSPRRENTTTPLQALSLLNGPFMVQQSGLFAERVRAEAGADVKAQVERAFLLAFGRRPAADEARGAADLVSRHGLPALARALMNANEFLYY